MNIIKIVTAICLLICVLPPGEAYAKGEGKSDAQITQILIKQSIASYSGSCPCPYNRASNGSKCGKRSAYSKPGGAEPLCYPKDVTSSMIKAYRNG